MKSLSKEDLKFLIKDQVELIRSELILYCLISNCNCSWIYEASKSEILRDILNNHFRDKESNIIDWIYLLIEAEEDPYMQIKNIYCISSKNANEFDLNILFRKDFKYMYKISALFN